MTKLSGQVTNACYKRVLAINMFVLSGLYCKLKSNDLYVRLEDLGLTFTNTEIKLKICWEPD